MIDLRLVTPYGDGFEKQVDKVIVRGVLGDMMLMTSTAPIVTPLAYDVIRIFKDGEEKRGAVHGGYVSMLNDVVTVSTTAFEWTDDIDIPRAEAAKEAAEKEIIGSEDDGKDIDVSKAKLALLRATNRLKHGEQS